MNAKRGGTCYLNGAFMHLDEARVSVLDRAFLFGDAVYEVIPVFDGKAFGLAQHLNRLQASLAAVSIELDDSIETWAARITRIISLNGGGDLSVYIQVSRGVAERNHTFPSGICPTVFAMCHPLVRGQGFAVVDAITCEDNRWGRCDIKSTSLLANVLLRNEAVARGAYEAILLRNGELTEGAASNVFVVENGRIRTPPLSPSILPGVTRALLLTCLQGTDYEVCEAIISAAALSQADEIWLTSSTRDLVCVGHLDGRPVGDGQTYPIAAAAMTLLEASRKPEQGV